MGAYSFCGHVKCICRGFTKPGFIGISVFVTTFVTKKLRAMKILGQHYYVFPLLFLLGCHTKNGRTDFQQDLKSINLLRGEITLCGSETAQFGKVEFNLSCAEKVRANFNLATALLHSFEYTEAEKVFAKVIDEDPECLMAYWGVAMSNFHPLWTPPTNEELVKGSRTIELARSLERQSKRESDYMEAVAVMYENWSTVDHNTRLLKFEKAAETIYQRYPDDKEAAIFYALALRAASSPADKSFGKQRKAGEILEALFPNEPDHPGIAHYLIHTYDYPELAELALPAARKYALIAAASAHALHMPSHIFTRLGLWDESIQGNVNSIDAAKCYAENSSLKGHWDEELHGLDYLVYAYLQQARDDEAQKQLNYLNTINEVFPLNSKVAYTFAAVPARYALERKKWDEATRLELNRHVSWNDFPWEKSIISFGRVLGFAHLHNMAGAKTALADLKADYEKLVKKTKAYEANQVKIQITSAEAWIAFAEGHNETAIKLMTAAATMEDATEKHPITPGEVIPARELLGDLYLEMGRHTEALNAYEANLKRHPRRFNGLYGAGVAAEKSGEMQKAISYFRQILETTRQSGTKRPQLIFVESFLKQQ
jgi:tetratricopeptide (TPR) repeat protein